MIGVATEQRNVPLYPLQRELLIQQASIDHAIPEDFVSSQEPECAKLRWVSLDAPWNMMQNTLYIELSHQRRSCC